MNEQFLELKKMTELDLQVIPPFNFKYTVYKPSHFPTKLEEFDEVSETFYRTYRLNKEKIVGLKMTDLQKANGKEGIRTEVSSNRLLTREDIRKVKKHITHSYGLRENINDFYVEVASDKTMADSIRNLNGMRNSCFETLYEILNISSLLQNTTVKRTEQMMENMLSTYGKRVTFEDRNFYAFYTPKDIVESSKEKLRELKVGYRAAFLMEIAEFFLRNAGFEEKLKTMSFDDAKNSLMKIKGVGPYTARIALFQYFRKANEINFDSWKRKIFSEFFFDNENETLEKVEKEAKNRWENYSGYAGLYVIENLFIKNPSLQYWKK